MKRCFFLILRKVVVLLSGFTVTDGTSCPHSSVFDVVMLYPQSFICQSDLNNLIMAVDHDGVAAVTRCRNGSRAPRAEKSPIDFKIIVFSVFLTLCSDFFA